MITQMSTLVGPKFTDSTSLIQLASYTFSIKPNCPCILCWHTGGNIGYLSYKINNGTSKSLGAIDGVNVKSYFLSDNFNPNDTITFYVYVNNISGSFALQFVDFK